MRVNGSNRKGSKKNYDDDDDDEEQERHNNVDDDDDDEDLVVFDVKGKGGKPPRPSAVFVSVLCSSSMRFSYRSIEN